MSGTAMPDVCVGLDLGTSGLKGVALDSAGRVLARAAATYPTLRPEPGAAEQGTAQWLRAVDEVVTSLAAAADASRWAGIGLSGMLPTLVALDAAHCPVGPAVTWQDARADMEGDSFRLAAGEGDLYRRTGQWVDGRYLLPMMTARQRRDGGVGDVSFMVGAKDFLFHHLTGELVTDPSTAAGYGCFDIRAGDWDAATRPTAWSLPEVGPATTRRPLRVELATRWGLRCGLPVVLGAADSVLGAHALGAQDAGDVAYLAGSSTVVLGVLPEPVVDDRHRYLVTPMVGGGWAAEMDLLATGSALEWWARTLGVDTAGELSEVADTSGPRGGPTFLPYLAPGEQGALWDHDLTGALVGLTLHHSRSDLARSLFTGIVLESARCLRVLGEVLPAHLPVRVGGGSAVGRQFVQDLADASARTLVVCPAAPDQSAIGAAWLTAEAVGVVGGSAVREIGDQRWVEPDPTRADLWHDLFTSHEAARLALAPAGTRPR